MTLKRKVITGLLWQVSARGGDKLLRMAANIVLARLLTPEDFGLMQAAFLALGAIDAIAFLASDQAIVHNDRGADHGFLNTVFWVAGIRGILIAAIIVATAPLLAAYFEYPDRVALFAAIAIQPLFMGIASPKAQVLVKDLDFKRWSTYRLASTAIGMVISIGLAFYLRSAWALVLGQMSVQVFQTILSYGVAPFRPRFSFDGGAWKAIRTYGLSAAGTPLLLFFIIGAPTLLLGRLHGMEALGVYSMNLRIASLPVEVALSAIGAVAMPAYAALKNDPERLRISWLKVTRGVLITVCPLLCVCAYFDRYLVIWLFGGDFGLSPNHFSLMAVSAVLTMVLATMGPLFWAIGRPSLDRSVQIPRLLVIYALGFALVPTMGILGMIIAGAASLVLPILMSYIYTKRIIGVNCADLVRNGGDILLVTGVLVGLALAVRMTASLSAAGYLAIGVLFAAVSLLYSGIVGLRLARGEDSRFRRGGANS